MMYDVHDNVLMHKKMLEHEIKKKMIYTLQCKLSQIIHTNFEKI